MFNYKKILALLFILGGITSLSNIAYFTVVNHKSVYLTNPVNHYYAKQQNSKTKNKQTKIKTIVYSNQLTGQQLKKQKQKQKQAKQWCYASGPFNERQNKRIHELLGSYTSSFKDKIKQKSKSQSKYKLVYSSKSNKNLLKMLKALQGHNFNMSQINIKNNSFIINQLNSSKLNNAKKLINSMAQKHNLSKSLNVQTTTKYKQYYYKMAQPNKKQKISNNRSYNWLRAVQYNFDGDKHLKKEKCD